MERFGLLKKIILNAKMVLVLNTVRLKIVTENGRIYCVNGRWINSDK
jgi:hypothetical protein